MAKHFIKADGTYAGGAIGTMTPPEAVADVPVPPEDGRQVWQNGVWVWPIDVLRKQRIGEVAALYLAALDLGLPYGGKVLQIREQDQGNITTMGNEARWAKSMNAPWPTDFAWRMADNSFLALDTPDKCIALALAAKAEVIRLRGVKWVHVDALMALQSATAVESYDIETGW